jgi:pyruvate, water dikinase
VDRSDDDYTRVIALNAPQRRPEANFDEVRQYAQRRVDYLDLTANQVVSGYFTDVVKGSPGLPVALFAETIRPESGAAGSLVLTFDRMLSLTNFVEDMREILHTLESAYDYPVDIEFTVNFVAGDVYRINLVQCRPLPVRGVDTASVAPGREIAPLTLPPTADRIIEARGAVIGHTRQTPVARFIYVVPEAYAALAHNDRYRVAALLGEINKATPPTQDGAIMLLGPGRWGTTTPALGVPVTFSNINKVSVLVEIVAMRENLIPDASLGTHFLNELVEMDMLYLALYPEQAGNRLDATFFEEAPNRLTALLPHAQEWANIVRVVDAADVTEPGETLVLVANALEQTVVCFRAHQGKAG